MKAAAAKPESGGTRSYDAVSTRVPGWLGGGGIYARGHYDLLLDDPSLRPVLLAIDQVLDGSPAEPASLTLSVDDTPPFIVQWERVGPDCGVALMSRRGEAGPLLVLKGGRQGKGFWRKVFGGRLPHPPTAAVKATAEYLAEA